MTLQLLLVVSGLVAVCYAVNPALIFPGPGGLGPLMGGSGRPGDAMSFLAPHLAGPGGHALNIWPGTKPGVTYPNYTKVPETAFSCASQSDGYYADVETRCQAARLCQDGNLVNSTLCPTGTMYHTAHGLHGICDWWYNVPCGAKEAAGPFFLEKLPEHPMQINHSMSPKHPMVAQAPPMQPAPVAANVAAMHNED